MKFSYIIIEQGSFVAEKLQSYFQQFDEYACIGAGACYDTSLNLILKFQPNLVFIDIDQNNQDQNINAFNFVNNLYKYVDEIPYIIALSKSTEQAYQTIKNNFFDYLLKPINEFELRRCLSRLAKMPMEFSKKLCIKSYKDYRFIEIDEILFLKADNNGTDFFMLDGNTISAFKTLKHYESLLPDNFTRIHNSYIVNQNYISRINFGRSECSIKKCPHHIPFSRSYKNNVTLLEKSLSKKALLSLN